MMFKSHYGETTAVVFSIVMLQTFFPYVKKYPLNPWESVDLSYE